jgi:hypothetical protein
VCCALAIVAVSIVGASAGAATKKPTVPGQPTITAVKAEVRGVRIAFKPPASTGGSNISSYRVKCSSSKAGKAVSRSGHKSPIKVFGLSPAKGYTCTVTARNKVGGGAPSAPSAPVVPLAH